MRLLSLDSSTLRLSAALLVLDAEGELAELHERVGPTGKGQHATVLPGILLELLEAGGVGWDDLDALVCGLGPGSFTGLRTGLATMKSLAYAARRPLVGASSLEAMALEASQSAGDAVYVPVVDARRQQVYAGFYRATGGTLHQDEPEAALDPEELLERLPAEAVLFGPGVEAYERLESDPRSTVLSIDGPSARWVAQLAVAQVGAYDPSVVMGLVPHYLRRSEAEIKLESGTLRIPGVTTPGPKSSR